MPFVAGRVRPRRGGGARSVGLRGGRAGRARSSTRGRRCCDLAADERRGFAGTVVAVTGANGKTSTKDMAAAVCARRFRTHASPASFNNEVGLPMTLLGAPPDTEVVVAEMGARHMGDVTSSARSRVPTIVVVTNVGVAHLEVFGSWEAIVEASAEPIEALRRRRRRDPERRRRGRSPSPIAPVPVCVTFGSARGRRRAGRGRHPGARRVRVVRPGGRWPARRGLARRARRAHGAQRVGGRGGRFGAGRTAGGAATALSAARITPWRMETSATARGVRVVNDAYNANPESVAAALKTARWMAATGA